MTPEQLQLLFTTLTQSGGMGALAAFVIWTLNKVWTDRLHDAQKYAETYRQDATLMREALRENTEVITKLLERLNQPRA